MSLNPSRVMPEAVIETVMSESLALLPLNVWFVFWGSTRAITPGLLYRLLGNGTSLSTAFFFSQYDGGVNVHFRHPSVTPALKQYSPAPTHTTSPSLTSNC